MRKILAVGAALLLGAGSAMAADLGPVAAPGGDSGAPPQIVYSSGWSGLYLGVQAGGDIGNVRAFVGPAGVRPGARVTNNLSFDGALGGGTVGYAWQLSPNWLLGPEGDFSVVGRKATGDSIPPFNPAFFQTFSEQYLATLRARVAYAPSDKWLLFASGGAAANRVQMTDYAPASSLNPGIEGKWSWGWTAGGGAEMKIADNWSVKVEYLYVGMPDRTVFTPPPSASYVADQKIRLSENIIRVGLNYHFGAPPPPAPVMPVVMPAPPPSTHRVFLVFFDWDRDNITQAGMEVVQKAADAYRSGASVKLMVTGYTDRSGSPGYNQRLSERRANNVTKALQGMGVPRDQMAVSGKGENDNRVPTAPGVREPQNRRVEIGFS